MNMEISFDVLYSLFRQGVAAKHPSCKVSLSSAGGKNRTLL
jgi:hypothetical protein